LISSKPRGEFSLQRKQPTKITRNPFNLKKVPQDNNSWPKLKINLPKPKLIPSKKPAPENKISAKFTPNQLIYPKTLN
jgi:hypothetical protein